MRNTDSFTLKTKTQQHIDDFKRATGFSADIDPHVYTDVLTLRLIGKTLILSRCIECSKGGCGKWSFSWRS